MKPILFSGEMVRAILNNNKSATRRPVRPRYRDGEAGFQVITKSKTGEYVRIEYYDEWENDTRIMPEPYRLGDILYVRETWSDCAEGYAYKADFPDSDGWGWRPSIHMPKAAARIFLRVQQVNVQKVKDVTEADAMAEGFSTLEEFIETIRKMYPDITLESLVWVIEFEQISKAEALRAQLG